MKQKVKIKGMSAKFHYVKTYPEWKLKICKLIKVSPVTNYWVELTVQIEDVNEVKVGDIIRFEDGLQSEIVSIGKENKFTCHFFETIPTNNFSISATYFWIMSSYV